MKFLHYEVSTTGPAAVEISLRGNEANVTLMDDQNFQNYRSGRQFRYVGGHYKQSPVILRAPSAGHWNVVVDLGGAGGHVEASVRVL